MMNIRSVSKSFPRPTSEGHQSSGSLLAVRAWQIHTTGSPGTGAGFDVWKTMSMASNVGPVSKVKGMVMQRFIMAEIYAKVEKGEIFFKLY